MSSWFASLKKMQELGIVIKIRVIPRPKAALPKKTTPKTNPPPVTPPVPKTIKYYLNDPTSPELTKEITPPTAPSAPLYTVVGYKGGGFAQNTIEGQAAGVYVTVTNQLNNINLYTDMPLKKWAATSNLFIVPRAGRMANAYYDRKTLSFFYFKDSSTGKDIFTSDSAEIVAHELGHAILDSYRPELWSMASMEIWAFHESFGDISSMFSLMQYDEILIRMLSETNNTLRSNNIVSDIAEQFGLSLLHRPWLRNSINSFKYVNPISLPSSGNDDQLTSEPHSFSRVMTGAVYDLLVAFYQYYLARSNDPLQSLKLARNILGQYTLRSIRQTPVVLHFYEGFAKTMLGVDARNGNIFQNEISKVFLDRNILRLTALAVQPTAVSDIQSIKLSETQKYHCSDNPLHKCKISIPGHDDASCQVAAHMLDYLNTNNKVGEDLNMPFEISNGKLIRSHFACCGGCNAKQKGSPEYDKPYKPQNNAGCGCSQSTTTQETVKKKVIRGCFLRYQVKR